MNCAQWGRPIDPGAGKCRYCGQLLSVPPAPTSPYPTANPFADEPVYDAAVIGPPPHRLEDDPAMRIVLPIGQSPLAIMPGYAGLISLALCFLGPVAVVLGVLAIRPIRNNPQMHGTYRAVIGIVLGTLGTLGLVAVVAAMIAES